MKKIIITLVIGFCLWSGASLRAAETFWDKNSNLIDLLFLIFCAAIVLLMVKVVRTVILRIPKRQKKDVLQSYFDKWLEY